MHQILRAAAGILSYMRIDPVTWTRESGMVDQVRAACEANYAANVGNCSGFVEQVAAQLNVQLAGLANDIVTTIRTDPDGAGLAKGEVELRRGSK
jgi:hypothetical protein